MPSSKNDRGMVAAVGRLNVVDVKDVAAAIIGVKPRAPLVPFNASPPDGADVIDFPRVGDWPLIDSMETVGEIVSFGNERWLRSCSHC